MRGRLGAGLACLVATATLAVPVLAAAADPVANTPPVPNFLVCATSGQTVVSGTCAIDPATGAIVVATPAREQAALEAISAARAGEGLPPLVLPQGFAALSAAEQDFVLVNLERIARGLAPLVGLSPALSAQAALGAAAQADPVAGGAFARFAWAANWASDAQPAVALYGYMYLDGWSPSGPTANIDCTSAGAAGCWDHRHNILGTYGDTGLFGSAAAGGSDAAPSSAQLYSAYTGPPVPLTYTWDQALAAGAGGHGLGQVQANALWPFGDLAGAPWAAGAAAVLAQAGVVAGTGPARFDPAAAVTLQEMVTFLGRILDWPAAAGGAPAGTASWAMAAMGHAQSSGLLPAGLAPTAPLDRLTAATLVIGGLSLPPAQVAMPYTDLGGLSARDVATLTTAVADGLLRGMGADTLAPHGGLTRAQAVVLLQRALLWQARRGARQIAGQSVMAGAGSAGSETYSIGAVRLLAPTIRADPALYWIAAGSGGEDALVSAAGRWWSGHATYTAQAAPAWAQGATYYGQAVLRLWPAGAFGAGPADFGPTAGLIGFATGAQRLLPGAAAWAPMPGDLRADPVLALAPALLSAS